MTRKTGKIVDIACGQYSSFLISDSGAVLGFGLTNCYQMGFPDREIRFTPEVVPLKDTDGKTITVKSISSGMHHTLFLTEDGKFYFGLLLLMCLRNGLRSGLRRLRPIGSRPEG